MTLRGVGGHFQKKLLLRSLSPAKVLWNSLTSNIFVDLRTSGEPRFDEALEAASAFLDGVPDPIVW